jgi:hypothetical protein
MPSRPLLTTVFEKDTDHARRRLWHLLLEGDRGCIIWWSEDCIDWKSPDYALTPKAKALAPVMRELTSPLARLFLRAQRVRDPIYLHYSQPSIQVNWLLESTVDGSTWLRRFSSFEAEHNRQAMARNAWLKLFQDLGFSPQFLSSAQIERGMLSAGGGEPLALVLPSSWALSSTEEREIGRLLGKSNSVSRVFFDGLPGVFDEHGRLRKNSVLETLGVNYLDPASRSGALGGNPQGPSWKLGEIASYGAERLKPGAGGEWSEWAAAQLAGFRPAIKVPPGDRVRVHRFRLAHAELAALERNINYQMSEDLKQAGGNEALEKPVQIEAVLARKSHVYELWEQKYVGYTDRIPVLVNPWRPALFALCEEQVEAGKIIALLGGK